MKIIYEYLKKQVSINQNMLTPVLMFFYYIILKNEV